MGSDRDDELARTATAPGSSSASASAPEPLGATLGRYKLERELGAGGMGVVHAAFDPDLERRIALKVLRSGSEGSTGSSDDAQKRLLREARAMARLTHPNVVTVHEVGSAGGRDYVAMELVEGTTLAEWLRTERRSELAILQAFFAAGRGLAAAHAAGIVHRDFKPHNVLRHKNGRIVVTDFGLAREAQADPMAATRPLKAQPIATAIASTSTPSSPLAGLTITGSVLGTPAYMAPEQWSGGVVSPATDQFAFCVALWEALAGERPFRGQTIEKLREEVNRGPAALDASKIPRRLREPLRRGLDPDPARRWPSMEALLSKMSRMHRESNITLAIVAAATVASAIVYYVFDDDDKAAPAAAAVCEAPVLDPDKVWPAGTTATFLVGGPRATGEQIDADLAAWRERRTKACATASDPTSRAQLACLDGVVSRLDAVARAVITMRDLQDFEGTKYLIDPAVCDAQPPPRLTTRATPAFHETMSSMLRERATPGTVPLDQARAILDRVKSDPCAGALVRLRRAFMFEPGTRDRELAEANQAAQRCGDDRINAEVALFDAEVTLATSSLGAGVTSKLQLAEIAVQRVNQPDLVAWSDRLRSQIARKADNLDEAISRLERAAAGYKARGNVDNYIDSELGVMDLQSERATPHDFEGIDARLDELRELALARLGPQHETVIEIDRNIAWWAFSKGDVAAAHARLRQLHREEPNDPSRRITGRVVDERGQPVAGATVAAGASLVGDSTSAIIPASESIRIVATAADGTFAIPDASFHGAVIAEHDGKRSRPAAMAESVTLKLEPTSRVEGKVDLQGQHPKSVMVVVADLETHYAVVAPVAPDGTFSIDGVARGEVPIAVAMRRGGGTSHAGKTIKVTQPEVRDVQLTVGATKRVVHVVVRSTIGHPVQNAVVLAMAGKHSTMTVRQLKQTMEGGAERLARQIEGEHAPPEVLAAARPGDMYATMSGVPDGVASACGLAFPAGLDALLQKKIDENADKLEVRCRPIPDGAKVVTVEVPPWPRLD